MTTLERPHPARAAPPTPRVPAWDRIAPHPEIDSPVLVDTRFRLITLVAVALLFALGRLAEALGIAFLGQICTSLFLQLGPGVAAAAFLRPLPRHVYVLISIVLGASVVVVAASVSALTGAFSLDSLWPVLAVAVLVTVAVAGVRDGRTVRQEFAAWARLPVRPPVDWTRAYPTALSLLGLVLALVAAARHPGDPQPAGAALTAGPLWFVGVALALAALGLEWLRRESLAVPVLTLTTVVVASQGLMYRNPTVVVAARHIGLVDYILVNGRLDRSTDIYQAWAGLFAAAALDVRAAGIEDLFRYAAWWGVLAAPVMVLAVRTLAGRFVGRQRAWLAGLLFGLGSSLNTSFFAPQVFGFVVVITVLALLVVRPGRDRLLDTRSAVVVVGVLCVAVALAHQISPYMLILALVTLGLFGLVQPRWSFLLAAVPALAWALLNWHLVSPYVNLDALGRILANLSPPKHSVGTFPVPLANRLAFGLPAVALVVIGLLALASWWRRRDRTAWALAATAASPVLLMSGTAYGQEGIFRVVLFALPWLAVLVVLPPTRAPRVRVPAPASLGAVAITLLLAVDVVGLTGMDWARVVRSGDVAATSWIDRNAPPGSAVLVLGTDLTIPYDSTAGYADTDYLSRGDLVELPERAFPTTTGAAYDAGADLRDLTTRLAEVPGTAHYALAAESTGAYDQRYGNQRLADHDALEAAIARSRQWQRVYAGPGVVVYRLRAG